MKIKNLLCLLLPLLVLAASCSKDRDAEKQAKIDEGLIVKFIQENNIPAQRHSSGVYYQVISAGTGNISYTLNTNISAKYTGRLLNGSVFDRTTTQPIGFRLGGVIEGWQKGIPLIQKGGRIRLIIPSGLAYGPTSNGGIPANSVLDFDVELVDVTN